jgi:hypothetical protein
MQSIGFIGLRATKIEFYGYILMYSNAMKTRVVS